MAIFKPDLENEILSDHEKKVGEPSLYKVLLINDDYTPMDFVVHILMSVFHLSQTESTRIMLNVHEKGTGVCGVYTWEIAETKVEIVHKSAEENGYPLRSVMEKE
jgi:ATP-dependent Clp protease adaptor protein ClpS